jgi:hypothetical protein
LFERRWPDRLHLPFLRQRRAALVKSRAHAYECLESVRQTIVTAGTAMHRSKLSLTAWFWAAHLMSTHSNGLSARQLKDQLGGKLRMAGFLPLDQGGSPHLTGCANMGQSMKSQSEFCIESILALARPPS